MTGFCFFETGNLKPGHANFQGAYCDARDRSHGIDRTLKLKVECSDFCSYEFFLKLNLTILKENNNDEKSEVKNGETLGKVSKSGDPDEKDKKRFEENIPQIFM